MNRMQSAVHGEGSPERRELFQVDVWDWRPRIICVWRIYWLAPRAAITEKVSSELRYRIVAVGALHGCAPKSSRFVLLNGSKSMRSGTVTRERKPQ